MMKRFITCLLAAALTFGLFMAPASAAFSDVSDAKTAENAAVLQMLGVIDGFTDGSFRPNDKLTRAQFTKMAISVSQADAGVSQYSSLTIFPDVRASHWAAGYVNYAVRKAQIIAGMPNGNFEPDGKITLAQAVTILMRLMGYSDETYGANWPSGYMLEAGNIGLTDGIGVSASAEINRAQAAQLFVNLLTSKNEEGTEYIDTISAKRIDNVILTSLSATADDGTSGAVRTAGASAEVYKPVRTVPQEFEGRQGSIVLNAKGLLMAFLPDDSSNKTITLSTITATYVTGTNGDRVNISSGTKLYIDGEEEDYSKAWTDLKAGNVLTAYYNAAGSCAYLVMTTSKSSGTVAVLKADPSTANPFIALLGLPSGSYSIVKNGSAAKASDIRKYDVATYNPLSKTIYISDYRLAGLYEAASPNTQTPTSITVMGNSFDLLETAQKDMESIKSGGQVTLLFTDDYMVAGVLSGNYSNNTAVGIVTSVEGDLGTVSLFSGIEISGKLSSADQLLLGQAVSVSSDRRDYLSFLRLSNNVTGDFDVVNKTVGAKSLTEGARIFDKAGTGRVREVGIDKLGIKSVPAENIIYAGKDYAGNIDLIILSNVTGDCYDYGLFEYGTIDRSSGSLSAVNPALSLTNSNGTTELAIAAGANASMNGKGGGLIMGSENVESYMLLTEIKNIPRSAFSGGEYLTFDGLVIPLADEDILQVYIKDRDEWTDLATARAYSDNLSAYYDRPAAEGGKIRLVVAN